MRGMFEIALRKKVPRTAKMCLQWAIRLDKRMLEEHSFARQFAYSANVSPITFQRIDRSQGFLKEEVLSILESDPEFFTVQSLFDEDKTFVLRKMGAKVYYDNLMQYLQHFPLIRVSVNAQPITASILKVNLIIKPRFKWSDRWNHAAENYWISVDDTDVIIYTQQYTILKKEYVKSRTKEFEVNFYIPFPRKKTEAGIYHISVVNENWIDAEDSTIIDLSEIEPPPEDYVHTKLEVKPLLPVTALNNKQFEKLYDGVLKNFNKVQTQVFDKLYKTDENVLVGAPTGSGKTIIGELAILRAFGSHPQEKVVYIGPLKALTKERLNDWSKRLPAILNKTVVELTGDFTPDLKALKEADLIITTPEKWDGITRHWEHREYVQQVALLLIDEIHLLGQERGPVLEVIVCRMRAISEKLKKKVRIVGLSTALANARDVSAWLGVKESGLFNFAHSERPVPLTVHVDGFSERAYCPRMATMNKPAFAFINQYSHNHPVLIFVSSRRQTRLTALDLIAYSAEHHVSGRSFLKCPEEEMQKLIQDVTDEHLQHCLLFGIGIHHAGLPENDRKIVEELFLKQKIQVLVTTSTLAWGVNFPARLVIVKGTEFYDYKVKGYVDFPMTDLLQMIGRAGRPQFDDRGIAYIMVQQEKKDFYQRFLYDPFPVESCLQNKLHDHINAEIAGGTIKSLQECINFISGTYYYRRLVQNPRYYGVGSSKSAQEVNVFLSKLATGVLNDLYMAGCITVDEKHSVESTELGYTASYYYLSYKTVQLFAEKLRPMESTKSSFLNLIELLNEATEFDGLPVRHNEEILNFHLAGLISLKLQNKDMSSPHVKAALLLLSYLLDIPFPIADFISDTKSVLDQCVRVIQGMIAISQTKGYLDTVVHLINILQMIVQGLWISDPPLLQLSRRVMNAKKIIQLRDKGITLIPHLFDQDEKALKELIGWEGIKELKRFPDLDIHISLIRGTGKSTKKELAEGEMLLVVSLKKLQGENKTQAKYGKWKEPAFYLVLGNETGNQLIKCVRFTVKKEAHLKYTFLWPEIEKSANYRVYLMSDSYLGFDQVINLVWDKAKLDTEFDNLPEYRKIGDKKAKVHEEEIEPDSGEILPAEYSEANQVIEKDIDTWNN